MRMCLLSAALLVPLGCAGPADVPRVGTAEQPIRLTPDPGPPPLESPPPRTLWRAGPHGWTVEDRVIGATADGRARIDLERRLHVDGRVVAEHVLPPLAALPDGALVFTRQPHQPERDLWRLGPDGDLTRLTHDGSADRPIATPDGRLLHIAAVDGRARWMLDGAPLPGAAELPPPAFADRHGWQNGRLIYDAGDGAWWLDPTTGEGGRR